MVMNFANQITLSRLVIAGIFFVMLSVFSPQADRLYLLDLALLLYLLAGLTDIIDGYVARRLNQVTTFGRVIDPFVDKVLVCGAFIFFCSDRFTVGGTAVSGVSAWMVVVILARELLVTGVRGLSESQGRKFSATVYGKAKMLLQSVAICWILFSIAHGDGAAAAGPWYLSRVVAAWVATLGTVASLLGYVGRVDALLRRQ